MAVLLNPLQWVIASGSRASSIAAPRPRQNED